VARRTDRSALAGFRVDRDLAIAIRLALAGTGPVNRGLSGAPLMFASSLIVRTWWRSIAMKVRDDYKRGSPCERLDLDWGRGAAKWFTISCSGWRWASGCRGLRSAVRLRIFATCCLTPD